KPRRGYSQAAASSELLQDHRRTAGRPGVRDCARPASSAAPAEGLGVAGDDQVLVQSLGAREIDAAARGVERDHAAVGADRRILVRALALREARVLLGARVDREDVEAARATGEREERAVVVARAPGRFLVVITAVGHAGHRAAAAVHREDL